MSTEHKMKKKIRQLLSTLKLDFLLIFLPNKGYLFETGWMKSYRQKKPMDQKGNPIPWFSYGAIHFLESRLTKDLRVFEFGSGGSTIWFSDRVKEVVSIENDKAWFSIVSNRLPKNVSYHYVETIPMPYERSAFLPIGEGLDNYSKKILEFKELFDVIIIDGIDRNNCVESAISRLAPGGVIIFDNCEYSFEFKGGIDKLKGHGFKCIAFSGLSPAVMQEVSTNVFYKSNNCLNI